MAFTAEEAFTRLQAAHAQGRFAHAYLLTGPAGSGKRALAVRLAGMMLEDRSADPLKNADAHAIEPESKSRRILTEQVRELEHALQMRSSVGANKVAVIFDADRLQPNAANAFLKTLEEPPARCHILLVSAEPDQMLETILSRCLEVPLRRTVKPARTALQERLLARLEAAAKHGRANLAAAFTIAREFQECLASAKTALKAEGAALLKKEELRYREASDARHWLDQREEYFDAASEARYQQERGGLLEVLELWWGDALRQQHQAANVDLPEFASATAALAARYTTAQLLRKAAALEELRANLGRTGVQEQLAVECAFLKTFAE